MTFTEVYLWNRRIGVLELRDGERTARFEYDRSFIPYGIEPAPLMMPLSRQVYSFHALSERSFHGLPGLFSDSLPDKYGNALIDAWLASQGRNPASFNVLERLCYTGKRGMGALEYVPATGPSTGENEHIEVERLVALASDILSKRENFHTRAGDADAMSQILRVGTSAGGARAKAIIAWNEESGDIRSGQIDAGKGYGYWIMKFDGVEENGDKELADEQEFTRIEYAYYLMATAGGIEMSESRLYSDGTHAHFMTKRFDRIAPTGEKMHMQSLGALAHLDFNNPRETSYEQAVAVMRRIGIGQKEIEQFYRRMVFNVMARNQDDHVKNISFLMDKRGHWSLAPAYDITYAYNPGGYWTGQHQMLIHGKSTDIGYDDLLSAAGAMDIGKAKAERAIAEVQNALNRWPEFAVRAGVSDMDTMAIGERFCCYPEVGGEAEICSE